MKIVVKDKSDMFSSLEGKNYDDILRRYTKSLFDKIIIKPGCLSCDEIYDLCTYLTKDIILRSANGKTPFLQAISLKIIKLSKALNNEDRLLTRYYQKIEPSEKIVDYLSLKYAYLLDKYKNLGCYDKLVCQFKNIIKDVITSLRVINLSIEPNLKVFLLKNAKEIRWDDEYVIPDLRKKFNNKFKDKIDECFLDELIMFYIDEYKNAYLAGNSKVSLKEYLITRLLDALKKHIIKVDRINEKIEGLNFHNIPSNVIDSWINNYAITHSLWVSDVRTYMFKQVLNYSSDDYDRIIKFKEGKKLKVLSRKK